MFILTSYWQQSSQQKHWLSSAQLKVLSAICIIAFILKVLQIHGYFKPIKLYEFSLPKMNVLYIPYAGKYEQNYNQFSDFRKQVGETFKISNYCGIYYDAQSVESADDLKQLRSVFGVIVNEGENYKVNEFLAKFPKYKQSVLPACQCIGYKLPYVSGLSFMMAIDKIYPKIRELWSNREMKDKISPFTIEIYNTVPSWFLNRELTIGVIQDQWRAYELD